MSTEPKISAVMVRLTLEERAALEQAAAKESRSLSQMARLLLIKSLPLGVPPSADDDTQSHAPSVADR